jgi:hypothetical protein
MPSPYLVQAVPHYDRLAKQLLSRYPDFDSVEDRAREILEADPFNRSSKYPIKKLEGMKQGEGQWRLALGRWRFRYDIYHREVVLVYCGLRSEKTYR